MVFIDPIQAKHERLTLSQGNIKTNPNPFLIRGKARRHKHVRQCCRNRVANLSVDRAVVVIDRMTFRWLRSLDSKALRHLFRSLCIRAFKCFAVIPGAMFPGSTLDG